MRILIIIASLFCIACPKEVLHAAAPTSADFYAKLYETRNSISSEDIDLINRFGSASTEWNNKTAEILRGYTQIISGKITPDQFVRTYGSTVNLLPIIIQKMRQSAYAMQNQEISSWHSKFFEIHQEMATCYFEFKTAIERGDYTEADNAMNRLRAAGEKKAKYVATFANRLRSLAGDKDYDKFINGEMARQTKIINN